MEYELVSHADLSQMAHALGGYSRVDKWAALPYDYQFKQGDILVSAQLLPGKGLIGPVLALSILATKKDPAVMAAIISAEVEQSGASGATVDYL